DPESVQRVDVAGNRQREGPHPGARQRIARQKCRLGLDLLEIFDDGQRLGERARLRLQGRHQGLRVEFAIDGAELLAAGTQKMHGQDLERQLLERKRDAHPIGGRTAEITVEPHQRPGSRRRTTFWSMAPKMLEPARSSISMRTRSPNLRNGVAGLPLAMVSTERCSAMQA